MDIKKLQRAIVDGLEDVKAQHIAVFNTEHLSSMFERVIIASGTSNRQTKALAASVRNSVKGRGMQVMSTEGEDNGEWIIVDCGAAVVHVMQPAIREYYHLEEIWGGKTVRMKVGEVNTRLVKASEPEPAAKAAPRKRAAAQPVFDDEGYAAAPAPARKAPAKRGAAKTEADKKMANKSAAFNRVAAKRPARPASKSAAPAPAGRPAAKTPAKTPTKSSIKTVVTPASKSAQKASAAKKAAVKKAPARSGARTATQVVSRKTPARKTSSR